jgi:transposase-like protein
MSSLVVACPFCGSKAKRFVLPNGITTNYYVCSVCNRSFTYEQSMLGEMARKIFNSKSDIIPSKKILLSEKESRYLERL